MAQNIDRWVFSNGHFWPQTPNNISSLQFFYRFLSQKPCLCFTHSWIYCVGLGGHNLSVSKTYNLVYIIHATYIVQWVTKTFLLIAIFLIKSKKQFSQLKRISDIIKLGLFLGQRKKNEKHDGLWITPQW